MAHGLTVNLLGWPFAQDEDWEVSSVFNSATHQGIDWRCARGTPIYAVAAGTVETVAPDQHFSEDDSDNVSVTANGTFVRINTDMGGGAGFQHVYLHLLPGSLQVERCDRVKPYQLLGLSGNTGNTTGPHLHLQFKEKIGDAYAGNFDFNDYLDRSRVRTQKDTSNRPRLQLGAVVVLKDSPGAAGANVTFKDAAGMAVTVETAAGGWYDIVGRPEDKNKWWQIVVPNMVNKREDVGWVQIPQALPDVSKFTGQTSWVCVTHPEVPAHVLRPPTAPPTVLRGRFDTPDMLTLDWEAPAADGITGYRIRGHHVPAPLVTSVANTGSLDTEWTVEGRPPIYAHLYYKVAALRGAAIGQSSTLLTVLPALVRMRSGATAAVPVRENAGTDQTVVANMQPGDQRSYAIVGRQALLPLWWQIRLPDETRGWVLDSAVSAQGNLAAVLGWKPQVQVSSWVTLGLHLRSGPGTAYEPPLQTLSDHSVWYEIVGKNATAPTWWRIRVNANTHGWVHAGHVDTRGDLSGVSVQSASSPPPETGAVAETAPGTAGTSGSAAGAYRNLVTNPDGRWAVWKAGTTVTANFSSPRSPVQYYARENRQPQFVVPVGFRPTVTQAHRVTGTRVNADRTPVAGAAPATFDLRMETDGELRYVDNSRVNDLGYVSYSVTSLRWQTAEELVEPTATATVAGSGTFINQTNHLGSSWTLTRHRDGTRVTGTFSCTRSPVDYYANGSPGRAAVLVLPTAFRPTANMDFTVEDAVRVNEDSTDSSDRRLVDFDLTMQRDGYMWYDRDPALTAAGVGYLRFSVAVAWTVAALEPTAPRDLEADEVEATEVELDWREPAYSGGASITAYRVEVYRGGSWRTAADGISGTRHTLHCDWAYLEHHHFCNGPEHR